MVKKKRQSKRVTLNDKYKIQRRVVESHRKSRKQAKRDAKAGIVRHDNKKKDPGIPNSWPFKQDLLKQIARTRERAEENKRLSKEKKSTDLRALRAHQEAGGTARTFQELADQAKSSQEEYAAKGGDAAGATNDGMRSEKTNPLGQSSRRAYLRELRKVVEASDVILQVLDARDPSGTRMGRTSEESLLSRHDKKMVLVLNKIDLVPKDAVSGWLTHLRRSHPTIAMKAGTNQSRSSGVGRSEGETALKSSSGVGVEGLLQLLKNYARTSAPGGGGKSKGCITVGIVGYPNVGKSSILNTLKRARAVGVSPRPGFTTSIQEVVLDRSVRLIDSPGVVFDDMDDKSDDKMGHSLLRNCVDADSVEDPIPAVAGLLSRCTTQSLMMTYEIPAFPPGDVMTFLALVARRSGRVMKGGIPDKARAARIVIRDWNAGKIKYFTAPPDVTVAENGAKGEVQVVNSFGEAFDVAKMAEFDREALDGLAEDGMDFVELAPTSDRVSGQAENEMARVLAGMEVINDEAMDEDINNETNKKSTGKRKTALAVSSNEAMAGADDYDFDDL